MGGWRERKESLWLALESGLLERRRKRRSLLSSFSLAHFKAVTLAKCLVLFLQRKEL